MIKPNEPKTLNLLIVDDHKVVRDGLRFILSDSNEYAFKIHEAHDMHTATYFGTTFMYDVILMDINVKHESGVDITKQILAERPNQKIIAFTVKEEEMSIREMIDAGAKGYLLKDSGAEEIIKAIETVITGKNFFSNEVALKLMGYMKEEQKANDKAPVSSMFNDREKEVLNLISHGHTNAEVAKRLHLSKNTIDDYRKRLLSKSGKRNTAELIRFAMENSLIE